MGLGLTPLRPEGEVPKWEDFLQNLGGSRWLGAITQYTDWNGTHIQNPTDLWAGEWFGSTNPLPADKTACTNDGQCLGSTCDVPAGHCYCTGDSDCWSNSCNTSTGLCYPTYDDFATEVNLAANHFQPDQDGIIVVALPPAVPCSNPCQSRHDSVSRLNYPSVVYVEAPYDSNATAVLEHEIAEAMTDPRKREHEAWHDSCDCEVADRCSPPPPGETVEDTLKVGESQNPPFGDDHYVAAIWSDDRNNGAGQCVNAEVRNEDYFFTDCSGNLRHINWNWFYGTQYSDNFGQPPGGIWSRPGVVSYAHDAVDGFVLSGGDVWQMWWRLPTSPGWTDWGKPSGFTMLYSPDAFSWRPRRIDVVAVGKSQSNGAIHVFRRYFHNGTYSGWQDWGAPAGFTLNSRVASAAWNVNRFDLFALSTGNPPHVWHGYSNDGITPYAWEDWGYPPGVFLIGGLDAASRGDYKVEVFAVSSDGNLWHKGYDHGSFYGWNNWGHPGTSLLIGVGAAGQGDGLINTVSTAPSPYLEERWWDGAYSNWDFAVPYPMDCFNGPDISAW